MRREVFIAATVAVLIAGCTDEAGDRNTSVTAINNAAAPAASVEPTNAVLGPAASADQAKTLMHDRHEGMEDIGDAFKIVGRELKAANPDTNAIRQAASTIAEGAEKSPTWFPPGTGPDVGKTRAKAEIWQKPQDFAAKDEDFLNAARAFKLAADSGDVAAIKARAGELGKTCKACHDSYRTEDEAHDR